MRDVHIIGIGQTPVTSGRNQRGYELAADAINIAIRDAGIDRGDISALYVGNMLAGILEHQQQLSALCADASGLQGIEALTIEASCGSGAGALRTGFMGVSGGFHEVVVVCGVERMTHTERKETVRALATASDWEQEGSKGESFLSLSARLMTRYMEEHGIQPHEFAPFAINAHKNGLNNPNAFLHKDLDTQGYLESRVLVEPLRLMDAPPVCDGAAAVVLASRDVTDGLDRGTKARIRVEASVVATDAVSIKRRLERLELPAVVNSSRKAFEQAGMTPSDMDFFEAHDAFTVITALSLEAAGFAPPGRAVHLGQEGALALDGDLPISTMGGLKARGHPVGATGLYQIVEAVQQLRGTAGENQIDGAEVAMTQNIGGTGATAITHILSAA